MESIERVTIPVGQIVLDDRNPRTITEERFKSLKESIKNDPLFLRVRPIVIRKDNQIICGNMRLRAVRELGWSDVEVVVADVSHEKEREWKLKDNIHQGEHDLDILLNDYAIEDLTGPGLFTPNDLKINMDKFEKKEKKCPECGAIL